MSADEALRSARSELLSRRLAGARAVPSALTPSTPRRRDALLTAAQKQMWLAQEMGTGRHSYLSPLILDLSPDISLPILRRAVTALADRHEVLRTRYPAMDSDAEPRQVVGGSAPVPLEVLRVSAASTGLDDPDVRQAVLQLAGAELDLQHGPVFSATLLEINRTRRILVLQLHHIATDGRSSALLLEDLRAIYRLLADGRDCQADSGPRYVDYASWVAESAGTPRQQQDLRYWLDQLRGVRPLDLPADLPRPARWQDSGGQVAIQLARNVFDVDAPLTGSTTEFMVALAALALCLAGLTDQDDIVVGSPVSDRPLPETEHMTGCFLNTLALRVRIDPDSTCAALLTAVRDTVLDALAHRSTPFSDLVKQLVPERDLSRNPLFAVLLTMHAPSPVTTAADGGFTELDVPLGTAKFDLSLHVIPVPAGYRVEFAYARSLYTHASIQRLAQRFERALEMLRGHPEARIAELDLMPTAERQQLLELGKIVSEPAATSSTVHDLVLAAAARTPSAPAIWEAGRSVSYQQLVADSDSVLAALMAAGVSAGDLVGILLAPGADCIAAALAVLRLGCGYLPLDPEHPAARTRTIVERAEPAIVVSTGSLAQRLADSAAALLVEDCAQPAGPIAVQPVPAGATAYVIYTSGSTGRPKGVQVSHANVTRLFEATGAELSFDSEDVWVWLHSFAFDFSVWEVWKCLVTGGRLVIAPRSTIRDPEQLAELIHSQGVTVLNQTPSAFAGLAPVLIAGAARAGRLRAVIFGGERLDVGSLRSWFDACPQTVAELFNLYGITETTVHATLRRLAADDLDRPVRSPIGRPLPDLSMYLLDDALELVPRGVVGEIYVGGYGVADGYRDAMAQTAERFVPDPFRASPGARMYRSGDLARWTSEGELDSLGRVDSQVKIRGYRIEIGEVEAGLRELPGVAGAIAAARVGSDGLLELVGWVAGEPAVELGERELRRELASRVPAYLVPARLLIVNSFPLSSNGKIDRARLPEATGPAAADSFRRVADSPLERALCQTWGGVLGVDTVRPEDSLFELGGDSIRAVRLAARLRADGYQVSVADLFEHNTVGRLAAHLQHREPGSVPELAVAPFALIHADVLARLPAGLIDAYPLSVTQAGMIYEMRADEAALPYHNVTSYPIEDGAPFVAAALVAANEELIARYEVLRTSIDPDLGDAGLQLVWPNAELSPHILDLRSLADTAQRQAVAVMTRSLRAHPLELGKAPLWRLHVQQLADDRWTLHVVECHAILDGWSHHSLVAELLARYRARRAGVPAGEAGVPVGVRFADFVRAEQRAAESIEQRRFWADYVNSAPELRLPGRASVSERYGQQPDTLQHSAVVPLEDIEQKLRAVARAVDVPYKTILLTGHLRAMSLLTGQRDFMTGLVSNGRLEAAGGADLPGMFLNITPIRASINHDGWVAAVRAVLVEERRILRVRWFPYASIHAMLPRDAGGLVSIFNYLDFHNIDRDSLRAAEAIDESPTEFPLHVSSEPGQLVISADLRRITAEDCERLAQLHRAVYEDMALGSAGRGPRFATLPGDQRGQALAVALPRELAPAPDLLSLIRSQAAAQAGALALHGPDRALTYGQLSAEVQAVSALLRRQGIGPESVVALHLPRGPEFVVGLLAVLAVGATYLPLDIEHPDQRLAYLIQDSGAQAVLVDSRAGSGASAERLLELAGTADHGRPVQLDIAAATAGAAIGQPFEPVDLLTPEQAAYLVYTSGSTGRPKGVTVSRRSLNTFLAAMAECPGLMPESAPVRLLAVTTPSFDIAALEMLYPLCHGGAVLLASTELVADAPRLARLVSEHEVNCLQATPSTWQLLRDQGWQPPADFTILCGGEAISVGLRGWFAATGASCWDLYGPTEATIWATATRLPDAIRTSGEWQPLGHCRAYVLDDALEPSADGAVGELYLGGDAVARGYHRQPVLTAERFVPDPHWDGPGGARLYRTGDLACRRGGYVEVLGRVDQQLKLRGYRIEIGEIEQALAGCPEVGQAVVQLQLLDGDPRLVGYLIPAEPAADIGALTATVAAQLRDVLPGYMVPGHFEVLTHFPLTNNAKVDRASLPLPAALSGAPSGRPPSTPAERALAASWCESLKLASVNVDDDFFRLGGHSLLGLKVASTLRTQHGWTLRLRDLVRERTLGRVAATLIRQPAAAETAPALIWLSSRTDRVPIYCVHPGGGSAHWYVELADELSGYSIGGLEWPALNGGPAPATDNGSIVQLYSSQILAEHTAGPVNLLGWCGGAHIAWEMARLLRESHGRSVRLALLDPVVDSYRNPALRATLASFDRYAELAQSRPAGAVGEAGQILRAAVEDEELPADIDPFAIEWAHRMMTWRDLLRASMNYRYRPQDVALTLLVSDELVATEHEAIQGSSYQAYLDRWQSLARGGLSTEAVAGGHFSVLKQPLVTGFGARLASYFDPRRTG